MTNEITLKASTRNRFILSIDGTTVTRQFDRDGTVVMLNDSILVVKYKGYSFNPGSRYSGLKTYVSPETVVYGITKRDGRTIYALTLGAWDNTRKKSR